MSPKQTPPVPLPPSVSNRRTPTVQKKLRAACEKRVVRWVWAKGDPFPMTPLQDERLKLPPARLLSLVPSQPQRGTYACGLDDEGRVVVKRHYQSSDVTEAFFEHRGEVTDEHYFFAPSRCTVTRYLHVKGRIAWLAHVFDTGEVSTMRFTWRAGRLAKVTSRGAGHDYDELFEFDAKGLLRIERVFRDGGGGSMEAFRRKKG